MRMPWYTKEDSYLSACCSIVGLVFLQRLPPLPSHSSLPDAVLFLLPLERGFCASLSRHRFGKGGARLLFSGNFLEKKCLCARYWKVSPAPLSDGLSGKTFPRCFAVGVLDSFYAEVFITRGPNGIGCVAHNIRSRRP